MKIRAGLTVLAVLCGLGGTAVAADRLTSLRRNLPWIQQISCDEFTADRVARAAAPILWPSPAESNLPIPLPLPGRSAGPVNYSDRLSYYYRVRQVTVPRLGKRPSPLTPAATLPVAATQVRVRYFFYFKGESGEIGHANDLESTELWLLTHTTTDDRGCQMDIFLWKVFGATHGLSWSVNSANLGRSPSIGLSKGWPEPFTCPPSSDTGAVAQACGYVPVILIEEGKHATAPDLNRDGQLTPMIDLNKSQSDAWGIRDALGTNSRVSAAFSTDQSVLRTPRSLVIPSVHTVRVRVAHPKPVEVIPAATAPACGPSGPAYLSDLQRLQIEEQKNRTTPGPATVSPLRDLLGPKGFCGPDEVPVRAGGAKDGSTSRRTEAFKWWAPENPFGRRLSGVNAAFRADRGLGASLVFPLGFSAPFVGGWAVGKVNVPLRPHVSTEAGGMPTSIDLIFMSSATRKLGWYGGGGWEWNRGDDFHVKDEGASAATRHGVAWEIGFKARAVEAKGLLLSGRIGYRFQGVQRVFDQRFVAEVGVGAW